MQEQADKLRVAVVEDDARFRHSLEQLLTLSPGFSLAASFPSADALLDSFPECPPQWDLILMDLDLPGASGIEATGRIKKLFPGLAVVVLTVFEAPEKILEAISAGADGYLLKGTPVREILAQLRSIAGGGAPLTPGIARTILELLRSNGRARRAARVDLELTRREQEVLRVMVQGQSYKEAAHSLGVSVDTVRTHIRSVYAKLQVHSAAAAVARAVREGLV